jgi:hypothetical protein
MVCLRLYRLGDGLVLGRLGMCLFLYCGSSWLVGMIFFFLDLIGVGVLLYLGE